MASLSTSSYMKKDTGNSRRAKASAAVVNHYLATKKEIAYGVTKLARNKQEKQKQHQHMHNKQGDLYPHPQHAPT